MPKQNSQKKSSVEKDSLKSKKISKSKSDSNSNNSPKKESPVSKNSSKKSSPVKKIKQSPGKSLFEAKKVSFHEQTQDQNNQNILLKRKQSYISDPNFPVFPDGSTYHLELKKGQVSNRILTVGDHGRGRRLLALLDQDTIVKTKEAARKFTIYTGTYKGTPVSIIVSLMGSPNVDFVIRETRYCIDGPMAIIREGSCGLIDQKEVVGTVIVGSKGSLFVQTTFAKELGIENQDQYRVIGPIKPSEKLSKKLYETTKDLLKNEEENVIEGLIVNSDSFYSSQGRIDKNFNDYNQELIDDILKQQPTAKCFEMESFTIYALAKRSKEPIYASALCISLAKRNSDDCIMEDRKHFLEKECGKAVFDTLVGFEFPEGEPKYTNDLKKELESVKK